ncbi:UNVERIFIED_CONTAM: hypothetical protein HDU68_004208, partial [Siphonaria sp. JEL0065]
MSSTIDGVHVNPAVTAMIVVASVVLSITVLVCLSCFCAGTIKVFGTTITAKAASVSEKIRKRNNDDNASTSSKAGLMRSGTPDSLPSLPDTASSSGTLIDMNFDPDKVKVSQKMREQLAKMSVKRAESEKEP